MNNRRFIITAIVCAFAIGSFGSADVIAETDKALEKRLKKIERKLKGTRRATRGVDERLTDFMNSLSIHGFISAGISKHNQSDKSYLVRNDVQVEEKTDYVGITDKVRFEPENVLGIQIKAKMSDRSSVTAQILALGTDDYDPDIAWAFYSYKATNNLTLRAGKMRGPFYMLSEFLDVGFAYPWVRPPSEVYNLPTTSYSGIDVLYDFELYGISMNAQGLWGSINDSAGELLPSGGDFDVVNLVGGVLTGSTDVWTFRAGYLQGDLRVKDGVDAETLLGDLNIELQTALGSTDNVNTETELPVSYTGLGVTYDDQRWLLMAEVIRLHFTYDDLTINLNDALGSLAPLTGLSAQALGDVDIEAVIGHTAYYQTIGYRFGDWLPYINFGYLHEESDLDEDERDASYQITLGVDPSAEAPTLSRQRSVTIGARYDLSANVSLKAGVTRFYSFNEVDSISTNLNMDDKNVYSFVVDAVF